jgi:uncharacterized protein DUF5615
VSLPLQFLADENFNNDILRGMMRRWPEFDFVRARDVGLTEELDPTVLDWADREERILLTHDVRTIPAHAAARLRAGLHTPGVFVIPRSLPVGRAIEDLLLIAQCSENNDWENQVRYLPL